MRWPSVGSTASYPTLDNAQSTPGIGGSRGGQPSGRKVRRMERRQSEQPSGDSGLYGALSELADQIHPVRR